MKRFFRFGCIGLAAVLVLLVIVAIVSPGPPQPARVVPTFTPAGALVATSAPILPTPFPASLARCLDVPAEKINAISTGLTVDGGGTLDTSTAQAVKSGDFSKVFFIAAAIHGSGFGAKGKIGIWASNSLDPSDGLIFAVDAMAKEFSDWGKSQKTDSNISQFDDGGQESKKCVEYKQNGRNDIG